MKAIFEPAARAEFVEAARWYAVEAGRFYATDFRNEVHRTLNLRLFIVIVRPTLLPFF